MSWPIFLQLLRLEHEVRFYKFATQYDDARKCSYPPEFDGGFTDLLYENLPTETSRENESRKRYNGSPIVEQR
jgi:hypothetical protein